MTITGQIADPHPDVHLAAASAVAPEAMQPPGLPVPDDKTAVAMFTAHRLDETLYQLAHAAERMRAARAASGDLRAYHSARVHRHLQHALEAGHGLTANIRAHYAPEAQELEQVKQDIGLAKAVSPQARAATTSHLLETCLHEETHGARHAEAMLKPGSDDEWAFNADHCAKHLGGALEHAAKLREHFADNYADEGRWLAELESIRSGEEDTGKQHARYSKGTVSAQLANRETVSGQVRG